MSFMHPVNPIALLTPFLPQLSCLLALMLGLNLLKSRWMKGYLGELKVRLLSRWHLDKRLYKRLHNVTLGTPDGTTQIDHVIISPYGIFVIETKNMKGGIFGTANQAQWKQKIFKHTFMFQNPLRQNYRHLKAVEAALQVDPADVHSLVAFVGRSEFKTPMPDNVTQGKAFIRYIRSFQEPVFSTRQVEALLQTLEVQRRPATLATHRRHVRALKRRHAKAAKDHGRPPIG
jgi:restriction system protein